MGIGSEMHKLAPSPGALDEIHRRGPLARLAARALTAVVEGRRLARTQVRASAGASPRRAQPEDPPQHVMRGHLRDGARRARAAPASASDPSR